MCDYVKKKLVERNKERTDEYKTIKAERFLFDKNKQRRQADGTQRWIMMEETDKREVTWIMQHDVSTTRLKDKQ